MSRPTVPALTSTPIHDVTNLLARGQCCHVGNFPSTDARPVEGEEEYREHVVQNTAVRIIAHTLDLDDEPTVVLRSVHQLVAEMRAAGVAT